MIKSSPKQALPIVLALIILISATLLIVSFFWAINLIQAKFLATNIPTNPVLTMAEAKTEMAEVQQVPQPPVSRGLPPPVVSAAAVMVKDLSSGSILFEKNSNKKVPIASTTKIMTALVASQYFKPNEVLTVTARSQVGGSSMGLKAGEQLTFRSLLYGLLLNSGNDAAYTMAANYPGGINNFVAQMNNQAVNLALLNTHFDNPAGFDSPHHYSSAADLEKVAEIAIENYQLARVVSTKETVVASVNKESVHTLKNLNKLLDLPGVLGIKTGTTPAARENLVALIEKQDRKILTVVLGSNDRFTETRQLMDWSYDNFVFEY